MKGKQVRMTKWRPSALTIVVVLLALAGLGTGLYPSAAAWVSSLNQSHVLEDYSRELENVDPTIEEQLAQASRYNDALSAGVVLESNVNVPTGDGRSSDASLRYNDILSANTTGLMGRVKISSIGVDLPIYHGTSEDILMRGAGHLEGSHLPIGGIGTHSVITAHRGLATSTMFTELNRVKEGDTFTLEVFGEVLTYEVHETKVVEPEATDEIRSVPGEDVVTLITCTPLGINSHRILVTGHRIPTPAAAIDAAGVSPDIPGFPWWAVFGAGGAALSLGYLWRRGLADARIRNAARERALEPLSHGIQNEGRSPQPPHVAAPVRAATPPLVAVPEGALL